MVLRLLITFLLASALMANVHADDDSKRALVIGNNAYKDAELINSVNDAKAIALSLKKLGFNVELLLDASKKQINDSIDHLIAEGEKSNSVSILYYSGHGFQFQDRNWMLGVDIRGEKIEEGAVDIQAFLSRFKPSSGSVTLVVLDACREYIAAADGNRGLAPLDAQPGTLIAFSTAPGRFASDGEKKDKNGVYTKYLIKYIADQGTPVEGVFKKVRNDVINETNGVQVPWENSSLTRDFYFAPAPPGYAAQKKTLAKAAPNPASVPIRNDGVTAKTFPSVDRLTQLYSLLAKIRAGKSPDDIAEVNVILKKLTGFTFSEDELKEMAKSEVSAGAAFAEVPIYSRKMLGLTKPGGAMFMDITHGRVAQRAGVKEGDVLLRVNGRKIGGMADLQAVAGQLNPGETVYATLFRDGGVVTVSGTMERASVEDLVYAATVFAESTRNYSRARELLIWCAGRNHAESAAFLANLEWNGLGGSGSFFGLIKDYDSVVRYAQAAADGGSTKGLFWMSVAYLHGKGVPQSFQRANELRQIGADQGAAWAFAGLGDAYLQGQGVQKDYVKARQYMHRAAAQGYFEGLYQLGVMNEEGLGGARDRAQAVLWYERAIATGNIHIRSKAEQRLRKLKR